MVQANATVVSCDQEFIRISLASVLKVLVDGAEYKSCDLVAILGLALGPFLGAHDLCLDPEVFCFVEEDLSSEESHCEASPVRGEGHRSDHVLRLGAGADHKKGALEGMSEGGVSGE